MNHERNGHEKLLEELLMSAEDPARALESRQELENCQECQDFVAEYQRALLDLEKLGQHESRAIEAALEDEADMKEGRAEQCLRDQIDADVGTRRSRWPSLATWPRAMWGALAAAAILLLVWQVSVKKEPTGVDPNVTLGTSYEAVSPVGRVSGYTPLQWSGEVPDAGWFEVSVFGENEAGEFGLIVRSPRVYNPLWSPAEEDAQQWPDRILWKVEVFQGSTSSEAVASCQAWAERSPD